MGAMDDMYFEQLEAPPVHVIFDAAEGFGLTGDEVWQTAVGVLEATEGDAHAPEYVDELAGALARRIVTKHRRRIARERGMPLRGDDLLRERRDST
jgi:hypothetical protein